MNNTDTFHNKNIFLHNAFLQNIINSSFTFTHELVGEKNEESKSVTDNVRFFRDTVTDTYVTTFLKDDRIRYSFINYTYHMINARLQTNINKYLVMNQHKPLYGKESVLFLFKGGNIMNFFVDKFFNDNTASHSKYANNLAKFKNCCLLEDTLKDFTEFIKTKFKISDIDYTIIINADNYARYTLIHGGIIKISADVLNEISIFFDSYMEKSIKKIKDTGTPETINDAYSDASVYQEILDNIDESYQNMKNLIAYPYCDEYVIAIINNNTDYIKSLRDRSIPLTDDIINYIKYLSKLHKYTIVHAYEDKKSLDYVMELNLNECKSIFSLLYIYQYLQVVRYLKTKGLFDHKYVSEKKIDNKI